MTVTYRQQIERLLGQLEPLDVETRALGGQWPDEGPGHPDLACGEIQRAHRHIEDAISCVRRALHHSEQPLGDAYWARFEALRKERRT